jgi:hypothetical protein
MERNSLTEQNEFICHLQRRPYVMNRRPYVKDKGWGRAMVRAFGPGHEVHCLILAVVDSVGLVVHVYRIRWDIKPWNGIIEHIAVQFKGVLMSLTHPVVTLASMNCGKV